MFVIGVAGQKFSGKNVLADRLVEALSRKGKIWSRTALADKVKEIYCSTFGVDLAFVEEWKVKDELPPGFDMTVRESLQFIGDGFRKIRSDIWVDTLFQYQGPQIISDVRRINEFMRVKSQGGLNILVGRPDKLNDDPHESESQIRPYVDWALHRTDLLKAKKMWLVADLLPSDIPHVEEFDLFVRNDSTLEDFHKTIDEQVLPFVKNYVFGF